MPSGLVKRQTATPPFKTECCSGPGSAHGKRPGLRSRPAQAAARALLSHWHQTEYRVCTAVRAWTRIAAAQTSEQGISAVQKMRVRPTPGPGGHWRIVARQLEQCNWPGEPARRQGTVRRRGAAVRPDRRRCEGPRPSSWSPGLPTRRCRTTRRGRGAVQVAGRWVVQARSWPGDSGGDSDHGGSESTSRASTAAAAILSAELTGADSARPATGTCTRTCAHTRIRTPTSTNRHPVICSRKSMCAIARRLRPTRSNVSASSKCQEENTGWRPSAPIRCRAGA
jgi:hypothetical protein